MSVLENWKPVKDYLICIDSDGCAMDTMSIKHIRCFGPCMVKEWNLEAWQDEILERWNEINLYSMTRGIQRFKGLAMALGEINDKYTKIQDVEKLVQWAEHAPELSNRVLEAIVAKGDSVIFEKALAWSIAVNRAIDALADEEKIPFEGVLDGLRAAHAFADIAIVSSANEDAVEEEWKRCGLMEYVDILLCQTAGSKAFCISELKKKGYSEDKILVIGDAPGDKAAAEQNHVSYFPILVNHEAESWKEAAKTGFTKFFAGNYAEYGDDLSARFLKNLQG